MKTQMGEFATGAYLKTIKGCDVVSYNVRPPGGGLEGLDELDVIGLNFKEKAAYLCEVTTHIRGLQYGSKETTIERIKKKHKSQKLYARKYLSDYPNKYFQFWSPVVPRGYLTTHLKEIKSLELIINETYTRCINELKVQAKKLTNDEGNPFFRTLQILEHLRK